MILTGLSDGIQLWQAVLMFVSSFSGGGRTASKLQHYVSRCRLRHSWLPAIAVAARSAGATFCRHRSTTRNRGSSEQASDHESPHIHQFHNNRSSKCRTSRRARRRPSPRARGRFLTHPRRHRSTTRRRMSNSQRRCVTLEEHSSLLLLEPAIEIPVLELPHVLLWLGRLWAHNHSKY